MENIKKIQVKAMLEQNKKMDKSQQCMELYMEIMFEWCENLGTHLLKGSDRLCKVVELSMQCCGKLLSDSFETY